MVMSCWFQTYVNRPELLLHVVGSKQVQHGGELQKQVVLESEHGSRSDQGSFGEDATSNLFTTAL